MPTGDKQVAGTLSEAARKVVKEIHEAETKKIATDPTIYNQGLRGESEEDRRAAAERNRRGIEILKAKSESSGAQVCTLSGKPPDPDYARIGAAPQPIDPASGQHRDYYVLCDEERAKGFVRPVRQEYKHGKCGAVTFMGRKLAETAARDPKFYGSTFCVRCNDHFPVAEFKWLDGSVVGS